MGEAEEIPREKQLISRWAYADYTKLCIFFFFFFGGVAGIESE